MAHNKNTDMGLLSSPPFFCFFLFVFLPHPKCVGMDTTRNAKPVMHATGGRRLYRLMGHAFVLPAFFFFFLARWQSLNSLDKNLVCVTLLLQAKPSLCFLLQSRFFFYRRCFSESRGSGGVVEGWTGWRRRRRGVNTLMHFCFRQKKKKVKKKRREKPGWMMAVQYFYLLLMHIKKKESALTLLALVNFYQVSVIVTFREVSIHISLWRVETWNKQKTNLWSPDWAVEINTRDCVQARLPQWQVCSFTQGLYNTECEWIKKGKKKSSLMLFPTFLFLFFPFLLPSGLFLFFFGDMRFFQNTYKVFPCPSDPHIYTEQCWWKIRTHVHLHTGEREETILFS